jgi:ABC-type molybdenum transport system ATPase subunit/photorepair protein PhrA
MTPPRAPPRRLGPRRAPPRLSIALHELSVRRGGKWALRDISWQLNPGERWALLGDNGAGKTQLLKALSGAVWPTPAASGQAADDAQRTYRRGHVLTLFEAKPHIAYIGAESQDT